MLLKDGFLTKEEDYPISIKDSENKDFTAEMSIFRRFVVTSTPAHAEVIVEQQRKGFTPAEIELSEGKHQVVVRLAGHLEETKSMTIGVNSPQGIDTLAYELRSSFPLYIDSEKEGLDILMRNEAGKLVAKGYKTNATVPLPYGTYKLELFNADSLRGFSGKVMHDGRNRVKTPFYSKGTFSVLNADYQFNTLTDDGRYGLLGSGSFGRFSIFRGLSTSILHAAVFSYQGNDQDSLAIPNGSRKPYPSHIVGLTGLLLNGELRIGGEISRHLDVAALGAFYWYPPLSSLLDIDHVEGTEVFVSIEVSTRISYFNVNFKLGQELFNGHYYFVDNKDAEDGKENKPPLKVGRTVFSVGLTLGGQKVYKSNNLFRLWKKPLASGY